jgi:hypothetical protein
MRVDDVAGTGTLFGGCRPQHRTPFDTRNDGSCWMPMTWQAVPGRPYFVAR